MEKSADAFRTISEVSDDLDLPQHVLRFWETRFPQIRPLKRAGGRRYYRPADIVLLRAIRQLLYDEGYTIKGVQRLLKEQGAKAIGAGSVAIGIEPTLGEGLALDLEPSIEPDPTLETPDSASHASGAAFEPDTDRAAIREALDLIAACEAILADVRRGPR